MNWAQLIPAESHDVLVIGLGAMVGWDGQETGSSASAAGRPLRSPFSQRSVVGFQGSDAQPGGGVAGEVLADTDVSGQHLTGLVAGLAHDVALADSVHGGLGDASGAQAVAAQRLRLQAGASGGPFENPADAVLVEPAAGELANPSDPAKDGTGGDATTPPTSGAERGPGRLPRRSQRECRPCGRRPPGRSSSVGDR